jgi:drug/metabolite transporter (DMT)-like permease
MTIFGALLPGGTWPRGPAWIGLLGGLAGVALLIGPWGPGRIDPFGAGCLIAATLSWSIGSIYAKGARLPKSPFVATAVEMMAGGAALLVVGAAFGQFRGFDVRAVSSASILASVYLAVFGSIVAFTAYVWLLSVRPPSQVATYAYVNPVVAVVLGWYFLDEQLTTRVFAAAGAIVASVALITTFSRPVRDVEVPNEQCA